ncbi:MAG: AMIN domain-containing protein [Myxococcales bacterium]|jgi:hypothetical protein
MVRAPKPLSWLATGALVLGGGSVQAQGLLSGGSEITAANDEGEAQHPPGAYMGVKPGGVEKPAVPATPGQGAATITWPGFQMRNDGSSRVFLQSTTAIAHDMLVSPDKIVIDLGDAKIAGETNRFPLITRYFNTPVDEVTLERKGGRTKLVLSMRTPAQPTVSTEVAPSGFFFLYVDFPPGQYSQAPAAAAAKPADTKKQAEPQAKAEPKQPPAPAHLQGDVDAQGKVKLDTSMDDELPPGMGTLKGETKAKGKVEAKGGFSL